MPLTSYICVRCPHCSKDDRDEYVPLVERHPDFAFKLPEALTFMTRHSERDPQSRCKDLSIYDRDSVVERELETVVGFAQHPDFIRLLKG
jgi:hypothetical protein